MKCSVEEVASILRKAGIEEIKIQHAVAEINKVEEANKNDAPTKRTPTKLLTLGSVAIDGQKFEETPLWVFKVADSFDHTQLVAKLEAAIANFREKKPKKAHLAPNIGLALQRVPAKFFKEQGIKVMTKDPVLAQTIQTPKDS